MEFRNLKHEELEKLEKLDLLKLGMIKVFFTLWDSCRFRSELEPGTWNLNLDGAQHNVNASLPVVINGYMRGMLTEEGVDAFPTIPYSYRYRLDDDGTGISCNQDFAIGSVGKAREIYIYI